MDRIPVHVWLSGEATPILAGEFSHDGQVGRFAYDPAYLAAKHPALAPDLPLRAKPHAITGGHAIFPLFLDAGPDTWGRHVLERRLERSVTEIEALSLCPTDGVGNIALGAITPERLRVLKLDEFLAILAEQEKGGQARNTAEEQVLDAHGDGTSLGGTKPKLTIERDGIQYLAKFPAKGDSEWLPHVECATLKLAHLCGVRAIPDPEVWRLPSGRCALLVRRFDRQALPGGQARQGYVSAHALLRLDTLSQSPQDALLFGTRGFTPYNLRRSYVALSEDMLRWCGSQAVHREERRELWRRIVFNALVRNLDDHAHNHGLLCDDMGRQHWRLSPAFDLVPAAKLPQAPALCLAYRFVPGGRRSGGAKPRLVWVTDAADLMAAAVEHYGYTQAEAADYLKFAAATVATQWQALFRQEGMPEAEIARFLVCFEWAGSLL
ncbi:MAG TPA: HipA domain-containing protein [Rhodocyclaceae bacterium]|nr:HipA domain-containing protein [Rhodocyclaceae bacterium]